ncbi:MAG: hypothetical protein KIT25_06495 [Enhydrobacter sp.]|nr:MAG: hypothetical protein KIT25_06495 [Enhydrobacter sp.]
MRRKSRVSWRSQTRDLPFVCKLRVHYPRHPGGHEAERAAAAAIGKGRYAARSLFDAAGFNMEYRFATGDQAHAMQIWFDAEGKAMDEDENRLDAAGRPVRRFGESRRA